MNNISETLRRERLRQGLDLKQLSDSTKISGRMLQAMEDGDLSRLPGGVFTRSFFKQYAAALGLDSAFVEVELRQISPAPEPQVAIEESKTAFVPFEADQPRSRSLTAATIWVVLALVGCGGVYYLAKNYQPTTAKPIESSVVRPERKPEPASTPAQPVASVTTPAAAPAPPAIGPGTLQVVLNASEQSWVSITVDGKLVFSGILQPNDRREINAEEKVKVVAGNAGGIDISLNGKNIDSLGPKGQVRTVELTRAGAQVVSRTPKPGPLL
jgi:cytoskeletal protein RodZ